MNVSSSHPLRVGMVLQGNFPPDIRVEKEARALLNHGIEVALLCTRDSARPQRETYEGIEIYRYGLPGATLLSRIDNAIGMSTFIYPSWSATISRFIREAKISALHIHDLPLAGTVRHCAKKYHLPFVADFHENYPAGLQVWSERAPKTCKAQIKKLVSGYARWLRYEDSIAKDAAAVVAVVDEMKERLIATHPSLSPEKIRVVSNTESRSFVTNAKAHSEFASLLEGKWILSYIGNMGPHRGLETALRAVPLLIRTVPEAHFLLVGKSLDGSYERYLKELVQTLSLDAHVTFLGWQPSSAVYALMRRSSVGVIPHRRNEHTDNTIPHKLFQYMMAERPLLVSDSPPLAKVVLRYSCGEIFTADDPESFAAHATLLAQNAELSSQYARNGYKATMEGELCWEREGEKLAALYREILAR